MMTRIMSMKDIQVNRNDEHNTQMKRGMTSMNDTQVNRDDEMMHR